MVMVADKSQEEDETNANAHDRHINGRAELEHERRGRKFAGDMDPGEASNMICCFRGKPFFFLLIFIYMYARRLGSGLAWNDNT